MNSLGKTIPEKGIGGAEMPKSGACLARKGGRNRVVGVQQGTKWGRREESRLLGQCKDFDFHSE